MNKAEVIKRVSRDTHVSTAIVSDVVDSLMNEITEEMARGGKVVLSGFGTFEAVERKARTGRDICAGKPIRIPGHMAPTFKAGKILKDAVYCELQN